MRPAYAAYTTYTVDLLARLASKPLSQHVAHQQ